MTKQDYRLVALAFRDHESQLRAQGLSQEANGVASMYEGLAKRFAVADEHFDEEWFLLACGPKHAVQS